MFKVTVPSFRATKDVTMKADIIEEITRIYGYDNFDVNTAKAPLYPVRADILKSDEDNIKDILVKRYSLHELHSYIWTYNDEYKALGIDICDNIKLLNATNPNIETIRNAIIPTQLCQVKYNTGYATDFGVFEIGRIVDGVDENNMCIEKKNLAITLFSKTEDITSTYLKLRDIIATIVDDIKHKEVSFKKEEATKSYQHIKNLNGIYADGIRLGNMGIVHPTVSKKIDKKASIVFLEIDMELFASLKNESITYSEPSRFPEMEIDLSFVSNTFEPIGNAIKNENCDLIKKVSVTDTYCDESGKSITVRMLFSHPERTLTREEVMEVAGRIIDNLAKENILLKS